MILRRQALLIPLTVALPRLAFAGLGSKKTRYVGGTWKDVKPETQGRLYMYGDDAAAFMVGERTVARIPYRSIVSLEYGQKVGRRIGATLGTTAIFGPIGLITLLSKKRKHYLTVGWAEEGENHGVVLELGKNVSRLILGYFRTKSGVEIEYESEEARKHPGN